MCHISIIGIAMHKDMVRVEVRGRACVGVWLGWAHALVSVRPKK